MGAGAGGSASPRSEASELLQKPLKDGKEAAPPAEMKLKAHHQVSHDRPGPPVGTADPEPHLACLLAQMVKGRLPMRETWVPSLGQEDPPEQEMAIHSRIIAWRIPWTEEPGGLPSMRLQRVGHDRVTKHRVDRRTPPPTIQNAMASLFSSNTQPLGYLLLVCPCTLARGVPLVLGSHSDSAAGEAGSRPGQGDFSSPQGRP